MHGQKTDFLTLILFLIFFVILEKSSSSWHYLILTNSPKILQIVDNRSLLIQSLKYSLIGHIVQPQYPIADSCRLEYFNPAHLVGIIAMRTTTGLDIHAFDIDNSDCVARYDTSLVQIEPMFCLCLLLALEIFVDGMRFKYDLICLILYLQLFLLSQR